MSTPRADAAREMVEWSWKNGGYQAYSEEEWVEQIAEVERDLAAARAELAQCKRTEREACAQFCAELAERIEATNREGAIALRAAAEGIRSRP